MTPDSEIEKQMAMYPDDFIRVYGSEKERQSLREKEYWEYKEQEEQERKQKEKERRYEESRKRKEKEYLTSMGYSSWKDHDLAKKAIFALCYGIHALGVFREEKENELRKQIAILSISLSGVLNCPLGSKEHLRKSAEDWLMGDKISLPDQELIDLAKTFF